MPNDSGRTAREQKQLDKEMSRLEKWMKMLKERNKWFPDGSRHHEKMTERVWKVINAQIFLYSIATKDLTTS